MLLIWKERKIVILFLDKITDLYVCPASMAAAPYTVCFKIVYCLVPGTVLLWQ
jgi:hypothetical protein